MFLLGYGKSQRVAWVWPAIKSMVCTPTSAQWTAHCWQLCICSGGWQTVCGWGPAWQWQCMQLCFILWHATLLLEICSPPEHSTGQMHGRSITFRNPGLFVMNKFHLLNKQVYVSCTFNEHRISIDVVHVTRSATTCMRWVLLNVVITCSLVSMSRCYQQPALCRWRVYRTWPGCRTNCRGLQPEKQSMASHFVHENLNGALRLCCSWQQVLRREFFQWESSWACLRPKTRWMGVHGPWAQYRWCHPHKPFVMISLKEEFPGIQ